MNTDAKIDHGAAQRPAEALRTLARDIWRYKFVVPAVAAIVAGAVAFYTMRQPKIYEATTTLEYDPNPSKPLGEAVEDTAGPSTGYWDNVEFYETQNYILRSRGLAERVVRKLALHQDAEFMDVPPQERAKFKGVPVEVAAGVVQLSLKVVPLADTRIVKIQFRNVSPERAQLVANAIADEYIEKSLEDRMGTSARALEWLSTQMANLKQELESSELDLYKFRESNDSLSASLQERQNIIASQLQDYSGTLTQIHTQRIKSEAHLSVLKDLVSRGSDQANIEATPVGDGKVLAELRSKYRESATALEKLTQVYGPQHPQVLALLR